MSSLWSRLPEEAIKLIFSTSPKTIQDSIRCQSTKARFDFTGTLSGTLHQTLPNLLPLTCLASNLWGGITHSPWPQFPCPAEDPPPLSGEEGLRACETHPLVILPGWSPVSTLNFILQKVFDESKLILLVLNTILHPVHVMLGAFMAI